MLMRKKKKQKAELPKEIKQTNYEIEEKQFQNVYNGSRDCFCIRFLF